MLNDARFGSLPATPSLPRPAVSFSDVASSHGLTAVAIDDLMAQLPVGIWVTDRNGRVVFANPAAQALRVDDVEALQWAVTRALLTEEEVREDAIEIVEAGRPRRWVSAHVMPIRVAGFALPQRWRRWPMSRRKPEWADGRRSSSRS